LQDGSESAAADGLSTSVESSQPHTADETLKRSLHVEASDIDAADLDAKRPRYEADGL